MFYLSIAPSHIHSSLLFLQLVDLLVRSISICVLFHVLHGMYRFRCGKLCTICFHTNPSSAATCLVYGVSVYMVLNDVCTKSRDIKRGRKVECERPKYDLNVVNCINVECDLSIYQILFCVRQDRCFPLLFFCITKSNHSFNDAASFVFINRIETIRSGFFLRFAFFFWRPISS